MVDLSAGTRKLALHGPSLASSWLGYARNPGFHAEETAALRLCSVCSVNWKGGSGGSGLAVETIRRMAAQDPGEATAHWPEDRP